MIKNFVLSRRMISLLLIIGATTLQSIASTPTQITKTVATKQQLPIPVHQQIEAINTGDVEGWLNLFSKQAIVNDWGRVFQGRDKIKAWSDKEFIGAKGQLKILNILTEADKTIVDASWKSNFYSGNSRFIFTVHDNKITEMRIMSLK